MIFHNTRDLVSYLDYLKFQKNSREKRRESILFLEHPPTITAGVNSHSQNLLYPRADLKDFGVEFQEIQRGGDHTGHEPGQIVTYIHLDLAERDMPVGDFIQTMQDICVDAIFHLWKIPVIARKDRPGLYWKEDPNKKLVSIGVYFKSFFTSFGMAINYENSLEVFRYINPCGISSKDMITLVSLGAKSGQKFRFSKFYADMWTEVLQKKYPGKKAHSYRYF